MEMLEDIIEAFPEFLTDEPVNGGDLVEFVGAMIVRYHTYLLMPRPKPKPIGEDRPEREASDISMNKLIDNVAMTARYRPQIKTYVITVTAANHGIDLHELDEDVAGTYLYTATSEEAALNAFHHIVAIKVLDDFDISAEVQRPPAASNMYETRNPKWLKPSMTMEHAAAQCHQRGCTLKARFDPMMGLTIIATRPRRESDS